MTDSRPAPLPPRRSRWRILGIAILYAVLVGPVGTTIHEAGHAFTAAYNGAEITAFVVGGLNLYPELRWEGPRRYFGWVNWKGELSRQQRGAVLLAGSGATWVVAILACSILPFVRWTGIALHTLRAFCLLHFDGLAYTFLPQWGMRHWGVFGGPTPEPFRGAQALGWDPVVFQTAAVAVSVLCTAILLAHLRRASTSGQARR